MQMRTHISFGSVSGTALSMAAVAVLVAGCSSSGSTATSSSSSAAAASAPTVAAGTLTLNTNRGPIAIAMDPKAPETVKSMTALSEKGFFNNTFCHRLTTQGIYVLQCGDPTGTGTGGPGYTVPDENLPENLPNNYPTGTVAMANSGPNTNGSQFFIVYQDTTLPPAYTIWGKVASGLDIVDQVAAAGVQGGQTDGPPVEKVVIETTKVTP